MKALAGLFSVLALALVAIGIAAWIWTHPAVLPPDRVPLTGVVDRIVIKKVARRMTVYRDDVLLQTYVIALGFSPKGGKERQGDGRTPEGVYMIDRRNAASAYHLSLGLDYPQPADRQRAAAAGYDPGGDIMIHGQPNGLPDDTALRGDWTAGCIAVTNAEMRELFAAVAIGTKVEIRP
jgi:murein L,D-transpeptidase YafK